MKAEMTDYSPDDEVQEVIDALLADEDFMASLDRLIDDADQTQAWLEEVMQEQENVGGLWQMCLHCLGIEVRIYERDTENQAT